MLETFCGRRRRMMTVFEAAAVVCDDRTQVHTATEPEASNDVGLHFFMGTFPSFLFLLTNQASNDRVQLHGGQQVIDPRCNYALIGNRLITALAYNLTQLTWPEEQEDEAVCR